MVVGAARLASPNMYLELSDRRGGVDALPSLVLPPMWPVVCG
jgi:hypothetical protein